MTCVLAEFQLPPGASLSETEGSYEHEFASPKREQGQVTLGEFTHNHRLTDPHRVFQQQDFFRVMF